MKSIFLIWILFVISACSAHTVSLSPITESVSKRDVVHSPTAGLKPDDIKILEALRTDYLLGPGDVIELFALDTPEISRKYTIGPDGKISIPMLGVLSVKGLSREQAANKVEKLLCRCYRDPKVTIIVEEYNNNRIYVLGEARKPGVFNFKGQAMLLGALARAEGLTDRADLRGCTIIRGKGTLIEVDLYELLREGNRNLNIPLLPEDTIYVKEDEEHTFYVLGEVKRPGVFSLGRKMDIIRGVSLAGGPTEDGVTNSIRLVRPKGKEIQVTKLDMDKILQGYQDAREFPIESGDIIYVPRKGIAKFNYILRQITPSLNTILLGVTLQELLKDND